MKDKKYKRTIGCLVAIPATIISFIIVGVIATLLTSPFFPQHYIDSAKAGMPYSEVKSVFPEDLLLADIHPIVDSKYSYARVCAEQINLSPTYLIVYHEKYWFLSPSTACYLYFDENKMYIGHYMSAS